MKINFASTRLAFFLIAILCVLLILSAIIPQQDLSDTQIVNLEETLGAGYAVIEWLALDRIYFSPYFFILLGLLAINLIGGNVKRFRTVARLEGTLLRARHLGSIIFHLSLILILSGVILNYMYKFSGLFGLTEGQTAGDNHSGYHKIYNGPFYEPHFERFEITLEKFELDFKIDGNTVEAAEISLHSQRAGDTAAAVYLNRPLSYNELEFHIGARNGYSPELIVMDSSGAPLFQSFVRLSTRKVEGADAYFDYIILPSTDTRIDVEALPKGATLDSTKFKISVEKGTDVVYNGTLVLNDTIRFDSQSLTIPRLRRWSYIEVFESPYLDLVFFGFWSALSGMVLGFIPRVWPKKKRTK